MTPAEAKKAAAKQKEQLKNFFDGLKKGIKAEKWQRMDKEIKISEVLEPAEFAAIFVGGKLIQPTPTNKPTSTVTIMSFSESQIVALFGTEWKPEALKGHEWTRGGIFDGKSIKRGLVPVDVGRLSISYEGDDEGIAQVWLLRW